MDVQGRIHINLQHLLEVRHYLDKIAIFNPPLQHSALLGIHRSRLRGRGMDFDQVRAYQTGDDARSIDWRVTARTGEVHTKVFHEERERPTYILVEQSLHLFFASTGCFKSVLAAQVAALFAWASLKNNDRVGGLVFDENNVQHIPPQRSRQSVLHLLQAISEANQALQQPMVKQLNNPLPHALQQAQRLTRPGGLIILICNERHLNEDTAQLLKRLAKHAELILLPLSDPLEHALPELRQSRFAMGVRSLNMRTENPELRHKWQAIGAHYQAVWQELALQLNSPLLPLSTQYPLLKQLQTFSTVPTPPARNTS
ncbi:DUF58 domain-containing protein [Denitrificimonas sp. JX-1]|uniref:DUF58 domain-containing protein n=1 Tax=Denitrificimonas halotolerans TaxID=3098930 RepID=A0ABU5GWS4_9GAMM|nr:DUF58 domain-containing protein [Denitrificimonas sp. JX-1]MDY7220093.1 DUF58 domain-containing protein [Denitrificimonas sp. JX-1]